METSAVLNTKNSKNIFHNFNVTKNVPIDNRFLKTTLSSIDDDLPLKVRYPGLIFFVEDAVINSVTGNFFYFDNELTTPIPFFSSSSNKTLQLDLEEIDYHDLVTLLNTTYSSPGTIVTVKPLNVSYLFDGTDWKYFLGIYSVSTEEIFTSIPIALKQAGRTVELSGGIKKTILLNLTLGEYSEDKFWPFTTILNKGKNRINHNFNSVYISINIRIYSIENIEEETNQIISSDFIPVDANNIDIVSSFDNVNAQIMVKSYSLKE